MLSERITLNTSEYGHLPWPERMDHFSRFGFQSLEVPTNGSDDEFKTLQDLLCSKGMKAVATHDWFQFFTPDDEGSIKWAVDRLLLDVERTRILGADRLIWYAGEHKNYEGEAAVDALLERLDPVLERAASLDVTIMLETEFGVNGTDPAASVALLRSLMTKADNPHMAINFDAANLYVADEEPFPYAYYELRPWIKHVHLKDISLLNPSIHVGDSIQPQEGHGRSGVCCVLGEGAVNMFGLLKALEADKYEGYLSLEMHVPNLDEALEKGLAFLLKHMDV